MTESCHWLNQVVTPITAAAPDVASLLEQTDTSPGTWHAATALAKRSFSSSLSMRLSRSQMPSAGKTMHTAMPPALGVNQLSHIGRRLVHRDLSCLPSIGITLVQYTDDIMPTEGLPRWC